MAVSAKTQKVLWGGGKTFTREYPRGNAAFLHFFFSMNFFILKTSLEVSPQAEARALHQRVEKLEDR